MSVNASTILISNKANLPQSAQLRGDKNGAAAQKPLDGGGKRNASAQFLTIPSTLLRERKKRRGR
jgi:hypothetical protein